jgi:hypothetical protein
VGFKASSAASLSNKYGGLFIIIIHSSKQRVSFVKNGLEFIRNPG